MRQPPEGSDIHDLCRTGSLVPSVVGPDQGWHFMRRIGNGQCSGSMYAVEDGWEPKMGLVIGGFGKIFFTRACVHTYVAESPKKERKPGKAGKGNKRGKAEKAEKPAKSKKKK